MAVTHSLVFICSNRPKIGLTICVTCVLSILSFFFFIPLSLMYHSTIIITFLPPPIFFFLFKSKRKQATAAATEELNSNENFHFITEQWFFSATSLYEWTKGMLYNIIICEKGMLEKELCQKRKYEKNWNNTHTKKIAVCLLFFSPMDCEEIDDDGGGGGDGRKGICSAAQDRKSPIVSRNKKKIVEERFAVIHKRKKKGKENIFSEAFVSFPFNHKTECDFHSFFLCSAWKTLNFNL